MTQRPSLPPEDLQFADLVVAQGLCSREKVDECLSFLGRLLADGVSPLPRLGELLARKGYLSPSGFDATLRAAPSSAAPAGALPPEAVEAAADPACVFGKYVKVSLLGSGGMGEVWKAWDRDLGRWAALKFLLNPDPGQLARFRREAQTAAALNHPHIAAVYEVGDAQGRPYIALQLVAGPTLASVPRDDLRRLVGLLRDAALAVEHAHAQGVIHRDLKPANLMVEGSRVFVMDFGLAKAAQVDASLSASGAILGTPSYMPPEQARGTSSRAGPASDVYSLGATLYDLLAGRPPLEGKDVYDLLRRIVDEEPLPLRRRNPRVPADLDTIVMKCLEKDPARRYASAQALADDLGRWLRGEAIAAHPPSLFYRARKFLARRKGSAALAAAALLAAGLLLPFWLSDRRRRAALAELGEIRTRMLVVQEWTRQEFRMPGEIRDALRDRVEQASAFIARNPDLPQGYYVRAHGRHLEGRFADAERDLREALRRDAAFTPAWTFLARVKLEEYDRALSGPTPREVEAARIASRPFLLEAQDALRRGGADPLDRWQLSRTPYDDMAETLARALRLRHLDGRNDEALGLLRDAQARAPAPEYCRWLETWSPPGEKAAWLDRVIRLAPLDPLSHLLRGRLRLRDDNLTGALADFDRALEIDGGRAEAWIDRAVVRIRLEDLDGARDDLTQALDLDPDHYLAWTNRSALHLRRRDPAAAERDAAEAIRCGPGFALGWTNRAAARVERRDLDGAIADATRAIELAPELALAHANRAAALLERGDLAGAAADIDRALSLDPKTAAALASRSFLAFRRGDLPAAIAAASAAIEIDPALTLAFVNRSAARGRSGDAAGALADADRAVELDARSARAWSNRSFARMLRMEIDDALRDATKAIELDGRLALAYVNRSTCWIYKNEPDRALADADLALKLDPGHATAHACRANAHWEKGDWDATIRDASAALALDATMAEAWCLRAGARLRTKDYERAIADAGRAIELLPGLGIAWGHRGEARVERRDFKGALEDCTRAVELVPALLGAWDARSRARLALGDAAGAIADATRAVELDPARPDSYLTRAAAREGLPDAAGAAKDLEKALELASPGWPERSRASKRLEELRRR